MSALLVSCEKPENGGDNTEPAPEPTPEPEYSITVSPAELAFDVEGGNVEVTITSSDEWSISNMPDWIEISDQPGENVETIIVTAEYNIETKSRSGEIVFTCGNKDAKVSVTQKTDESPIIQFKDPRFLDAALKDVDANNDGQISEKEASICTHLSVFDAGIRNLEEIKFFTSLTELTCSNNQLTSLDVSNNTVLTRLWCNDNQLATLDVSNNTALTYLECFNNQLASLDVSNNRTLTFLECGGNQLTTLEVSDNTVLTTLWCSNNKLTSLDLSKNVVLTELECYNNQLATLDVSKNTALTRLMCYSNSIKSLDVSMCRDLERFKCVSYGYDNHFDPDPHYDTKLPLESLKIYKYHLINEDDMTATEEVYGDVLEYIE